MSNENFKGHENWDKGEGGLTHGVQGVLIILLCKVYGTVEHPETNFTSMYSGKKGFLTLQTQLNFLQVGEKK